MDLSFWLILGGEPDLPLLPPRGDCLTCYPYKAPLEVYYAEYYPKIRCRLQILWAFKEVGLVYFERIGGYPTENPRVPLKIKEERWFLCYMKQNMLLLQCKQK